MKSWKHSPALNKKYTEYFLSTPVDPQARVLLTFVHPKNPLSGGEACEYCRDTCCSNNYSSETNFPSSCVFACSGSDRVFVKEA